MNEVTTTENNKWMHLFESADDKDISKLERMHEFQYRQGYLDRQSMLWHAFSSMWRMSGLSGDGKRDYKRMFGYLPPTALILESFYKHDAIAKRVGDILPDATWTDKIIVTDGDGTGNDEEESEFDKAWRILNRKFKIIQNCRRLDISLAYSDRAVMFFHFKDLDGMQTEELTPSKNRKLLNIRVFGERKSPILQWETETNSARLDMPKLYNFRLNEREYEEDYNETADPQTKRLEVHASRCIEVAENKVEDLTYGESRLKHVFARIQDLDKVFMASSESVFNSARNSLILLLNQAGAGANSGGEVNVEQMGKQFARFYDDFKKTYVADGHKVENIATNAVNPSGNVDKLWDIIAGACKIPKRILVGAEAGQLASSQDESNFASVVESRRTEFAGPEILDAVIEKLIFAGVLPEPRNNDWKIIWPKIGSASMKDQSVSAQQISTSIEKFIKADGRKVMPLKDYVEKVLGMEYDPKVEEYWEAQIEKEDAEKQEQKDMAEKAMKMKSKEKIAQNAESFEELIWYLTEEDDNDGE